MRAQARRLAAAAACSALLVACAASAAGADTAEAVGPVAGPSGASPMPAGRPAAPRARQLVAIARRAMRENDLKAVIMSVRVGRRELVTRALGSSLTGVPATRRMRFRNGNVAIAYLTTVLLRLQDRGRLSADDKLSKWFPDLPHADRITLRMLANSTSGYSDYVRTERFDTAFDADPFRQWTPAQLIRMGTAETRFPPGTSFDYSHTGFVILGEVLRKATGRPVARLIREHVLRPLRLRGTRSSQTPRIPRPALHAFTRERGTYEESTYWNASWGTARGANMTSTIADVATSAQAIGSGRLLSRSAHRQQVGPATAGLGGTTRKVYYGMGMPVMGGWIVQNPSLAGYGVMAAHLPARRITIAVVATKGEGSEVAPNLGELVARRIAAHLAPRHPIPLRP